MKHSSHTVIPALPELLFDPPLPHVAAIGPFAQTIHLMDAAHSIGHAAWATTDPADGVAQLIAIEIAPPQRRDGHARRLLDATINQMLRYHAARQFKLRRVWTVLRQQDHVIARTFLAGRGFQHVSSIPNLFHGQDSLVYVRGMD